VLGSFPLIELKTLSALRTSRHIGGLVSRLRPKCGSTGLAITALAAYFGVAGTAVASARAGPPAQAHKTPESRQYHSFRAGQYHRTSRRPGHSSASLSQSRKLANSIHALVISRHFSFLGSNSVRKSTIRRSSATRAQIGSRNVRSINSQIEPQNGANLRMMVDIGAVLGLCYAGFLAVWIWATRFRMRPRSSAPS